MGHKDLRTQGIALVVKWVAKASQGGEPYKVLIKHNISLGQPCRAKNWRELNFSKKLAMDYNVSVLGSNVFKSI